MKSIAKPLSGILLIVIVLFSCETDPVVYSDDLPIPVIYGILDNKDTVHYIRIGKTFGAKTDPAVSALVYDSVSFDHVDVSVWITFPWDTIGFYPDVYETVEVPKDSGFFHNPDQKLYKFIYDFKYPIFFMGRVHVRAEIGGLAPALA